MANLVQREDHGPITRLVMNSPGNFNALSCDMISALTNALDDIATDSSVRVIVLAAAGKAFCAGHDLRQMQAARDEADGGRAAFTTLFRDCAALMQRIVTLPQPAIAEVQGIATAAGCQLVASCDMAVAADGAKFGVNGINIGLFCATPMVALTRAIPPRVAFEMLTTGAFIDAGRAHELGLVNRVVAASDLRDETMTLARTLAEKLPSALQMGKRAFYDQAGLGLADAYSQASKVICDNLMLPETAEGMAAFIEKRPPNWASGDGQPITAKLGKVSSNQ